MFGTCRPTSTHSAPAQHSISYRPDIDGLRAVAVIAVVLYHAGAPGITGGFVGVDIFFVISGFLITTLILQQQADQRFRLRDFYARRARRLFPALLAVLLASTAVGYLLLMPREFEDFGESLATTAAFASNLLFWSEAGYFEGPSELKPLLHTWSLAIEEQYYLLFPLILIALHRYEHKYEKNSQTRYVVIGLLFAVSLALSSYYVHRAPSATFFLLPHRFWELLIGSALAFLGQEVGQGVGLNQHRWLTVLSNRARTLLALAGALSIGWSVFAYSRATAFPGPAALLPCLGTAAIILAGSTPQTSPNTAPTTNPVSRLLGSRAMVAIGLISYSLYLWHWPVLVFLKHWLIRPPTALETGVALCAAILLAWLSWRFIEQPFRRGFRTTGNRQVLKITGAVSLALIATGLAIDKFEGVPARLPQAVTAVADYANDKPAERKRCTGIEPEDVTTERLCRVGKLPLAPDFLVWGDSHAMVLMPEIARLANATGRTGLNATRNGCPPLLGVRRPEYDPTNDCGAFNQAVLKVLANNPSIKQVLLISRWAIYAEATPYKMESGRALFSVDDETEKPGVATSGAAVKRGFQRTLAALGRMQQQPSILASVPEVGWRTPEILAKSLLYNRPIEIAPTAAEHQRRQQQVLAMLAEFAQTGVRVVHPDRLLCGEADVSQPDRRCLIQSPDNPQTPLYIDEDHLSSAGASLIAPTLREALAR